MTAGQRRRYGPCYLMDLAGEVTDAEVDCLGLTRVSSDPCALITDDDSAIDLAGLLLEIGSLGAGDGKSGGGDSFWMSLAEGPLAAILQAAGWYFDPETGKDVWGGGIRWARAAAQTIGLITDTPPEEDAPLDLSTPSWDTAVLRCATIDSLHGDSLVAAKSLDPKQRDSIGINMRVATKAWSLRRVAGQGDLPPFTPDMLLTPNGPATLYVTSPLTGAAAPAATATLTSIVNHWRLAAGKIPTLLMVIDECPSTAPLPRLGAWIADLRSYGVRIVAACQASSQFAPRWGDAGLRIFGHLEDAAQAGAPGDDLAVLQRQAVQVPASDGRHTALGSGGNVCLSLAVTAPGNDAAILQRQKVIVSGCDDRHATLGSSGRARPKLAPGNDPAVLQRHTMVIGGGHRCHAALGSNGHVGLSIKIITIGINPAVFHDQAVIGSGGHGRRAASNIIRNAQLTEGINAKAKDLIADCRRRHRQRKRRIGGQPTIVSGPNRNRVIPLWACIA